MMGFDHPVIWTFLRQILLQQNLTKAKIAQSLAGAEPPASTMSKTDKEKNRRITHAVKEYAKKEDDNNDENVADTEENDMESDSDSDADDSATPEYGQPSQLERIESNPDWKLMNLIALNSRLK